MARYFENTSTFNFSWDQVASGYWKRYPNPQSTHVLSEDTYSRQVKDGCLYTKRLLTKTNRVPKWGERSNQQETYYQRLYNYKTATVLEVFEAPSEPEKPKMFFSAKSVKIIEESIVDPEKKVLVTYTRNLGYTKVMSVIERVEYRAAGAGATVAKRSAWIDSQVFGFSRAIRAFGVERFRKNCSQMYNGFNGVLHSLFPKQQHAAPPLSPLLHNMRDAAAAATDRAKRALSVNRT